MSTDALVRTTVAHVRVEPDQRSELFSQALLGEGVSILEERGRWLRCRVFAEQEGWIHCGFLTLENPQVRKFQESEIVVVKALHATTLGVPDFGTDALAVLSSGSRLADAGSEGDWQKVLLPDGHFGYIRKDILVKENSLPAPSKESIKNTALSYMWIPYLWGGTSTLAMDCSGLVQLVYRLHKVMLLRNSWDQATEGEPLEPAEDWGNLRVGDLLFFAEEEKVDHVALSLGGAELIHASMSNGCVACNSLNSEAADYSPRLAEMFHSARRVVAMS